MEDTVMQHNHNDADDDFNYSDIENTSDEEDYDDVSASEENESTILINMMESEDWAAALSHITHNPASVYTVRGMQQRTPLHLACHHDAPAVVIQALLRQHPAASLATGTSSMNPLHITCSSPRASAHVVRVLQEWGRTEQFSMRDIDGDTPLHAACRCGASVAVLSVLLRAYPDAVTLRDYEELTPLSRLWVRYVVMLGASTLRDYMQQDDVSMEILQPLAEAWDKTCVLLRTQHAQSSVLHAAAAVDGPRAVVHFAARLLRHDLTTCDAQGYTPLHVACQAPVYPVRDLSDGGYRDVVHGGEHRGSVPLPGATTATAARFEQLAAADDYAYTDGDTAEHTSTSEPSVIRILLQANHSSASQGAAIQDPSGRYPLHLALEHGKTWQTGVQALVQAYPDALALPSGQGWLPFQLAALKLGDDLSTVYSVVRNAPQVVQLKRRRCKSSSSPSSTWTGGAPVITR